MRLPTRTRATKRRKDETHSLLVPSPFLPLFFFFFFISFQTTTPNETSLEQETMLSLGGEGKSWELPMIVARLRTRIRTRQSSTTLDRLSQFSVSIPPFPTAYRLIVIFRRFSSHQRPNLPSFTSKAAVVPNSLGLGVGIGRGCRDAWTKEEDNDLIRLLAYRTRSMNEVYREFVEKVRHVLSALVLPSSNAI